MLQPNGSTAASSRRAGRRCERSSPHSATPTTTPTTSSPWRSEGSDRRRGRHSASAGIRPRRGTLFRRTERLTGRREIADRGARPRREERHPMHRSSRMPTRWLDGGAAAVLLAMGGTPVLAGPPAYLSNLDEASVTVVDTTSLTETATIPLPGTPSAIVAGASGIRVYVSYLDDTPSGGLAVIDVATHTVRTVSFGQVAAGLAVDAAESRAFVADVAEVAVIDLVGPSLATTFSGGTRFPFDVAIDHATGQLYVT